MSQQQQEQESQQGGSEGPRVANTAAVAVAVEQAADKLKNNVQAVTDDVKHLREAVERMQQFYFMRSNAHAVHGLQDWTLKVWIESLTAFPEETSNLARGLGMAGLIDNGEVQALAEALKQRLGGPMTAKDWRLVVEFQNKTLNHEHSQDEAAIVHYLSPALLSNHLFDREFPLGIEGRVLRNKYGFAVRHSGLYDVKHRANSAVTVAVYGVLAVLTVAFFAYLATQMTSDGLWTIADTVQDLSDADWSTKMKVRNKERGTVASLLTSASFSLTVNALVDKFGLIDPSSSTVFIGMVLGGTWGFVLDNMLGTDEGFREYLWSSRDGMAYSMGLIASERYARFFVTLLVDMFFTVILFKLLFPKLVQLAGFTVKGREWIANGFTSAVISVLTFKVYANMTRFEWAYPSGTEHAINQWISGQTMVLVTVTMNTVYLIAETRSRVGEPGINDPDVKFAITCFTYGVLWMLQSAGVIDPSVIGGDNATLVAADPLDVHLPLRNVCKMRARSSLGFLYFVMITAFCLGFVIFGTSAQSLTGLREACCGCSARQRTAPAPDAEAADASSSRASAGPDGRRKTLVARNMPGWGHSIPIPHLGDAADRIQGQVVIFLLFFCLVAVIVLFFTFVPLYSHAPAGGRNDAAWRAACDVYDAAALAPFGLS